MVPRITSAIFVGSVVLNSGLRSDYLTRPFNWVVRLRLLEFGVFRNIIVNLIMNGLPFDLLFRLSSDDVCGAVAVSWSVRFHLFGLSTIDISMINIVSDELGDRWWDELNGLELVSWVERVARLSIGLKLAKVGLTAWDIGGTQLIIASIESHMQVSRLTSLNINV